MNETRCLRMMRELRSEPPGAPAWDSVSCVGRRFAAGVMLLVLALLAGACAIAPASDVAVDEVKYADGDAILTGYLAQDRGAAGKRPGVLIVHEWWGVTPHVRDYARDLASRGYVALAIDMYGQVAQDPKKAGELMRGVMGNPATMKSRFAAAREVLARHPSVDPRRIAAVGFSMGGRVVLQIARGGEDLAAVASIYGTLETPEPAQAGVTKARVLVIHAEGDPFVKPDSIPTFRREMESARVDYRFVSYTGVKHGFANPMATDRGRDYNLPIAYDADADRRARAELFSFLSEAFSQAAGHAPRATDAGPGSASGRVIEAETLSWSAPTKLGFRHANIVGDPSKPGMYIQRVRIPAGVKLPAHTHPDERLVTVLSGTVHVGYGDQFDETRMRQVTQGGSWTEPAGVAHFTWAKDDDAVVQIVGAGPSAFHYARGKPK